MSAFAALTRSSGAAKRRLPGLRAFTYLAAPIAAIAIVVGVQFWSAAPSDLQPAPAVSGDTAAADPLTDLMPAGQIVGGVGIDTSDTDARIAFWQERLRATPLSDTSWTYLGELYERKARQTGDLTNYTNAEDAFARAVDIAPSSPSARLGMARIDIAFHDFDAALMSATEVLELYPDATAALAIIFDAAYELGDIDLAGMALSRLADRIQAPAVTVRQARLAFVRGDSATAVSLARTAAVDAVARGERAASVAFFHYIAADFALLAGDPAAADAGFRAALEALPGYSLAIYGRGAAALAHGDIDAAIEFLEAATAAVPRPDHVALLGDLYQMSGRTDEAQEQYETVDFIHQLATSQAGTAFDREYALFLADHGRNAPLALELAQAESEVRQDVYGLDTLAWTLHANGRDAEALTSIRQALAVGTVDARLLVHAGLIELANGLTAEGAAHLDQALALNPSFSPIVVNAARAALEEAR